jgi:hypothetical protein
MTIYYIYEIPGKKIGVSKNPSNRAGKRQGATNWNILEEHTCIKTVSIREQELQKQYGYKVDSELYCNVMAKFHNPKARAKAAKNLDYKSKVANTDYSNHTGKQMHTPEARAKARANNNYSNHTGKQMHTPEARIKAVANTDWKARTAKIDYKKSGPKIGKANQKPVNQYDLNGNFIKQWESAKIASDTLNIKGVSRCCNGYASQAGNFIWKHV